jgi:hypothetical protein
MQVVKNILLSLLVVWFAFLLFMPKQEIYYTFEAELLKQGVEINEKQIEEGIFSLSIRDVDIYVKGIHIASIEEMHFFTLLFYSSFNIETLNMDDSLKSFVPLAISKTVIMHSILSPFEAFVTTMGSFGLAEGVVDLEKRTLRMDLIDVKEINDFRSQLKKDKKGWYYETSF